ncbi:cysteine desulfurase family protein [Calidifontibacillus oryziterrae]|uniref:cysteine desulfurase family protein n=1 Tax=Calidifontibacillus oryziterrae TaxID=1191699 RepID=UPI0002DC8AEB|nr:cysteine desulfurase family protein [Calidifontibacillus oryziterrae]
MQQPIYLDHAATTPTHPLVVEEMIPYMVNVFGNPSSVHSFGRKSRHAVDESREIIAKSINAKESEIIFTSGGTEADNLALMGVARAYKEKGNHIITTAVEHHAVLHTCKYLEKEGFEITYLPVNQYGEIDVEDLKKAIKDTTILVSIMLGNNEVGTMQPIQAIGELLAETDILFHSDAVQAFGSVEIDVNELRLDLMSASAHKINGPKGIGLLYVRKGVKLVAQQYGGEQERKRRAGTENVPGIIGFKKAVQIVENERAKKIESFLRFKERMITIFTEEGIAFAINNKGAKEVLPQILNVSFPGTNVESLLVNFDLAGVAASSGSACTAGSIDPSHVLVAMFGQDASKIHSSIRFSFGYGNTVEQVEEAAYDITKIVKRLT